MLLLSFLLNGFAVLIINCDNVNIRMLQFKNDLLYNFILSIRSFISSGVVYFLFLFFVVVFCWFFFFFFC